MKLKSFSITSVALFLLLLPSLIWAWQGKVVHVTDGDTIVVLTDDKEQVRVRLYGIDALSPISPLGEWPQGMFGTSLRYKWWKLTRNIWTGMVVQ